MSSRRAGRERPGTRGARPSGRPPQRRRLRDGLSGTRNRHGRPAHGSPADATPIRGVVTTRGACVPPGAISIRSGEPGSHRSRPVAVRSRPNASAHQPGARGQPRVGHGPAAGAGGLPGGTHLAQTLDGLDGADEQRGRSRRGLGDDVQAVVHAVDKVHVGDARRPEHDPVARGRAHAGVRCTIVPADVSLDLHDPAGSRASPPGWSGSRTRSAPRRARAASSV